MQVQEQLTTAQADRQAAEEAHAAQASQLQAELARQQAKLEAKEAAAEELHAASQSQEGRIGALQQVSMPVLCAWECLPRCDAARMCCVQVACCETLSLTSMHWGACCKTQQEGGTSGVSSLLHA